MPNFNPPSVEIGRTVLFHVDGDKGSAPCPAFVIVDAGANLTLGVIRGHTQRIEIFDGVMHVDDPRVKNQYNDSGAWDYTEWDRKIMLMLSHESVKSAVADPPKPTLDATIKRGPGRPRKPVPAGT